jgi:hypothetical protein
MVLTEGGATGRFVGVSPGGVQWVAYSDDKYPRMVEAYDRLVSSHKRATGPRTVRRTPIRRGARSFIVRFLSALGDHRAATLAEVQDAAKDAAPAHRGWTRKIRNALRDYPDCLPNGLAQEAMEALDTLLEEWDLWHEKF